MTASAAAPLSALALNCTLKASSTKSSTQRMVELLLEELALHNVKVSSRRIADYDVAPGVEVDMKGGDQWPELREEVLNADILVLATPIWLGHPSSYAQKVLERLDAEISLQDDHGRAHLAGKVAAVAVVGNEDGAHKVAADLFQGLNDVGFSIPTQGSVYWVGEAMGSTDFQDLPEVPEQVISTIRALARNSAHLANTLRQNPYPPLK